MASSSKEHAYFSKDIGQKQVRTYTERRSIRVILLNDKNRILTMKSSGSSGLYRLPGGGIEGKEYLFEAGARAVLEETGYEVELGPCMAVTEEWRGDLHLTCFCCRVELLEDAAKKILTEGNSANGPEHKWISVEALSHLMKDSKPVTELARFIKERDMFFLDVHRGALSSLTKGANPEAGSSEE